MDRVFDLLDGVHMGIIDITDIPDLEQGSKDAARDQAGNGQGHQQLDQVKPDSDRRKIYIVRRALTF